MSVTSSDSEEFFDPPGGATTTEMDAVPTFSLPQIVQRFLDWDEDSEPLVVAFTGGNVDYFEVVAACETCRYTTHRLRTELADVWFRPGKRGFAVPTSPVATNGQQLGELMADLTNELNRKRERILASAGRRPIIEAFLDKMDATEQEREIFRYVVVATSRMIDPGGYTTSIVGICELFSPDVSLSSILSLVGTGKWTKERIYCRANSPTFPLSTMSDTIVLAFMGVELTLSQYQELESTTLQDVLLDDEEFQRTEAGMAMKHKDIPAPPPPFESPASTGGSSAPLLSALSKKERKAGATVFDIIARHKREASMNFGESKDDIGMDEGCLPPNDDDDDDDDGGLPTDEKKSTLSSSSEDETETDKEFGPYSSDLDYLEDQIKLMEKTVTLNKSRREMNAEYDELRDPKYDSMGYPMSKEDYKLKQQLDIEKLEARIRRLQDRIQTKLAATRAQKKSDFPLPRLEQLCDAMRLRKLEKFVILALVQDVITPLSYLGEADRTRVTGSSVGDFVECFSSSLEEKMRSRKYFYKSSTLVKEGIITISQLDFMTDLTRCVVELDRRMFDFIVGLDTEFSETVDGSHLYVPDVSLSDVVLPDEMKKQVCDCVLNFDAVSGEFHRLEIDKKITYGVGQVILFYGASGTGKTMLANAIAAHLQKKVLLVNFPNLGTNTSGALIKFLFREARINKALLFFDECESLFLSREHGATSVNMILTELERYDGLCILATNRPCDLDEAMFRRITMAVEFKKPDHIMRKKIWQTLRPPKLPVEDSINFRELALKYELTGGHIKNVWLRGLGLMVQSGREKVTQKDLMQAASEQVTSSLSVEEFDSRIVPTRGIDALVVAPQVKKSLCNIIRHTKAQMVLFGQWGFDKLHRVSTGVSALFVGPPGTGKTLAAEAIGFDLGKPLKVVNIAQVVSKWVGETGKNIEALFDDAKKKDAVLVFDEAEGLFGKREIDGGSSSSRHDTMNVGLLLRYIENFSGVCIAVTNKKEAIDEAFFRRFQFVLDFERPDCRMREELWKTILPPECPLAPDVSLQALSQRYDMCGGNIKSALLRAATRAALRDSDEDKNEEHVIHMADLVESCEEEMDKTSANTHHADMYA